MPQCLAICSCLNLSAIPSMEHGIDKLIRDNKRHRTAFDILLGDSQHTEELIQRACSNELNTQSSHVQNMCYTLVNFLRFYQTMSQNDKEEIKEVLNKNSRCPHDFYEREALHPINKNPFLTKDETISVLQNNPEFSTINLVITTNEDDGKLYCQTLQDKSTSKSTVIEIIKNSQHNFFEFLQVTY